MSSFFNGFGDELIKLAGKPHPGSGARFDNLVQSIAHKKGHSKIRDPEALAASIGRKKYGKKKFQAMAKKAGVWNWLTEKKKPVAPAPVKPRPVPKPTKVLRTPGAGQRGLKAEGVFGATR